MSDEQNEEQRINPAYDKYDDMQPEDLIKAMAALEERKDRGAAIMKEINGEIDFLRLVKIPTLFDEREIRSLNIAGIGRCQLTADVYASIKSGKKEDAFQWLRDSGRGSLIQEAVNASTLKAATKEAIKKGDPFPDDFFNVKPYTRASIVKV